MRLGFHAPETEEELKHLVDEAVDKRTPLEVLGKGTKREIGHPVGAGAVVSTEAMVGISLYEPTELVMVAKTGTPLSEIEAKLASAQVIDPKALDADGRCVFGATVEIEDQDSGEKLVYQIVGDDEADIKESKISIGSPVDRALIGKSDGDIAEVQAPGGVKHYELLDVRYE